MTFSNIKQIVVPEGAVKKITYNGATLWERISRYLKTVIGKVVTVTDALNEPAESLKVTLEPIQSGSGTPSPDNVRPISGHTECVTEVCGVNLFDKTTALDGYIDDANGQLSGSAYYKSTDYIRVIGGGSYYIASEQTSSMWGAWYDENKRYISGVTSYANQVITAPSNASYVRLTIKSSATGNVDTFAVNYPSTDHDYHAYDGESYTTTLGRTVYGGTLDVVSGVLTVDRAMVDLGTLTWQKYSVTNGTLFRSAQIDDASLVHGSTNFICSNYATTIPSTRANGTASCSNNKRVDIIDNSFADATASDFKTAMNGVQLCYELATPQTYQLDPQTISLLHGNNNVWSDGSVELTYWGTEQSN